MTLLLLLLACATSGSDTSDTAAAGDASTCAGLCTGAGFPGGEATDFGGGLVECVCDAGSGAIEQADCATYCDQFGVAAEDSILSTSATPDDKCVCDGTDG